MQCVKCANEAIVLPSFIPFPFPPSFCVKKVIRLASLGTYSVFTVVLGPPSTPFQLSLYCHEHNGIVPVREFVRAMWEK